MALLKLRRHTYFLDCDAVTVEKISNGRFAVTFSWGEFSRSCIVVGGRESGGTAHEWFVSAPDVLGDAWYPCGSMIAAIRAALYV